MILSQKLQFDYYIATYVMIALKLKFGLNVSTSKGQYYIMYSNTLYVHT